MPTNKNAVIRYRHIDKMLSHKYKRYSTQEICGYVNEQLVADGFDPVSLRCIQKDIKALEEEVFMVELVRENIGGKECVRYEDPSFSIFTKRLSDDEESLLSEMLGTIGQFEGLDNFEWLDGLKQRLGIKEGRRIIQFDHNPDYLAGSTLLGELFTAISNKQVIALRYHTFASPDESRECVVYPYLLKQYNNRWFLIAAAESDGYVLNFALDRIDGFEPLYNHKYVEPSEELVERFEDVVGVTIFKGAKPERILLWVSDEQWPYVETKPLHGSQRHITGERACRLREEWGFEDGEFVEICCLVNHELRQLLGSFVDGVVVLTPAPLRKDMAERVTRLAKKYF